ncbi:MAG TPA: hypothetical protein VF355_01490 [Anaerolineaceae bacterium]
MNALAWKTWLARLLIGPVFFFNVQCALAFLIAPQDFSPAFELAGAPGEGMVRGMGILFLMWNVPYAVALWNPWRNRRSLYEAVAMQAIGFGGETLLLLTFPTGHALVRSAVERFMLFDASGLVLLVLAKWIIAIVNVKKAPSPGSP